MNNYIAQKVEEFKKKLRPLLSKTNRVQVQVKVFNNFEKKWVVGVMLDDLSNAYLSFNPSEEALAQRVKFEIKKWLDNPELGGPKKIVPNKRNQAKPKSKAKKGVRHQVAKKGR